MNALLLALIGLTPLGIALILTVRHYKLDAFPAGLLVFLFGILASASLDGFMLPTYVGLVGFAVLGSLGILQEHQKAKAKP
jgi:hypothetical protein